MCVSLCFSLFQSLSLSRLYIPPIFLASMILCLFYTFSSLCALSLFSWVVCLICVLFQFLFSLHLNVTFSYSLRFFEFSIPFRLRLCLVPLLGSWSRYIYFVLCLVFLIFQFLFGDLFLVLSVFVFLSTTSLVLDFLSLSVSG